MGRRHPYPRTPCRTSGVDTPSGGLTGWLASAQKPRLPWVPRCTRTRNGPISQRLSWRRSLNRTKNCRQNCCIHAILHWIPSLFGRVRTNRISRTLLCRHPQRFLFGSDLVTRHGLPREHYASRYWCQRTLWESSWEGRSPIADPDYTPAASEPATPPLRGLNLPPEVLEQVYHGNACRLFGER